MALFKVSLRSPRHARRQLPTQTRARAVHMPLVWLKQFQILPCALLTKWVTMHRLLAQPPILQTRISHTEKPYKRPCHLNAPDRRRAADNRNRSMQNNH